MDIEKFKETKIKMIMKLRNISRAEAELFEATGEAPDNSHPIKSIATRRGCLISQSIADEEPLITAEEFFGL